MILLSCKGPFPTNLLFVMYNPTNNLRCSTMYLFLNVHVKKIML